MSFFPRVLRCSYIYIYISSVRRSPPPACSRRRPPNDVIAPMIFHLNWSADRPLPPTSRRNDETTDLLRRQERKGEGGGAETGMGHRANRKQDRRRVLMYLKTLKKIGKKIHGKTHVFKQENSPVVSLSIAIITILIEL